MVRRRSNPGSSAIRPGSRSLRICLRAAMRLCSTSSPCPPSLARRWRWRCGTWVSGPSLSRASPWRSASRRATGSQALFFTNGLTATLIELGDDDPGLRRLVEHSEMIYDGANAFVRVADSWTGFSLTDPGGPRGPNDPLWPLDALFGTG